MILILFTKNPPRSKKNIILAQKNRILFLSTQKQENESIKKSSNDNEEFSIESDSEITIIILPLSVNDLANSHNKIVPATSSFTRYKKWTNDIVEFYADPVNVGSGRRTGRTVFIKTSVFCSELHNSSTEN